MLKAIPKELLLCVFDRLDHRSAARLLHSNNNLVRILYRTMKLIGYGLFPAPDLFQMPENAVILGRSDETSLGGRSGNEVLLRTILEMRHKSGEEHGRITVALGKVRYFAQGNS